MRVKGTVFSGFERGKDLMAKWGNRLTGMLGFKPFAGTLNVRLTEEVDMEIRAEKKLEHLLINGKPKVEAYLAPATLTSLAGSEQCWAMRQTEDVYPKNVVELLSSVNLREKLKLKDGDEVGIELTDAFRKTKVPGFGIFQKIMMKTGKNDDKNNG